MIGAGREVEKRPDGSSAFAEHRSRSQFESMIAVNRTLITAQQPTDAKPGSLEKIAVLRLRAAWGIPLWHPDDAQLADRRTGRGHRKRTTPRSRSCATATVVPAPVGADLHSQGFAERRRNSISNLPGAGPKTTDELIVAREALKNCCLSDC